MFRQTCLLILPKRVFWNSTVSFSHAALKENFSKKLKVIKDCNKAHKFVATLLDGKSVIYSSTSTSRPGYSPSPVLSLDEDELNANIIIIKLKDMIHESKLESAPVDLVLKALYNRAGVSGEASQKLMSLFSNFETFEYLMNPKCNNPIEHLKDFIRDMESFVRLSIDRHALFHFITFSNGALKMLECMLFACVEHDLLQLLNIVDKVVHNKHSFSVEDKREFDTLISDVVSPVITFLSRLNNASKNVEVSDSLNRDMDDENVMLDNFFVEQINRCYLILDKVPIYYMTLKEKLLKYARDSKSCSNAYEFSDLLSKCYKYSEESKTKSLNSDLIIYKLRDIINAEKPEYNIINMILMSLLNRAEHIYDEACTKMSGTFADIDNFDVLKPKYQNSEKYLNEFASHFIYLVYKYSNKSIYNDYGNFSILTSVLHQHTLYNTQHLLDTMLQIHLSRLRFSEEEIIQIGTLMVEAMTPISKLVSHNSNIFSPKIRSCVLKQRSSLQCLKDFLGSIPIAGDVSFKTADVDKVDMCIQVLDAKIKKWCDLSGENNSDLSGNEYESDNGCYFTDHEEGDTDLDEAGAPGMPVSHTWWTKCLQVVNKIKHA